MLEALKFTKGFVDIPPEQVILHCCKSVLFHNGEAWIKKSDKGAFNVPQGSFGGTEVSELMGFYILDKINEIIRIENHRLYWDHGSTIQINLSRKGL